MRVTTRCQLRTLQNLDRCLYYRTLNLLYATLFLHLAVERTIFIAWQIAADFFTPRSRKEMLVLLFILGRNFRHVIIFRSYPDLSL